jgi:deoxyribonuclease-4
VSEARFEGLPLVLETPGPDRSGPTAEEIAHVFELRRQGLAARAA